MPKISLHVEADTPEEFRKLMAMFNVAPYWEPKAGAPQSDTFGVVDIKTNIQSGTQGIKQSDDVPEVRPMPEEIKAKLDEIEATEEPVEEKKARKPRGPNKPKMTPVTEEAPEEVEHVGTVAVAEEQGNGEVLTRMDLGDTIAGYVRKYGINFAQTDVSKMLQDMFGADVRKKSDVPDDQPSLRKAISAITQATIDNPYNRKVDVNG
jgi:hypothetical protein